MSWPAAERAIAKWVRDATSLQPVWAFQAVQRPDPPYVLLHIAELDPQGHDEWTVDAPEPSPPFDQELVEKTRQWWILSLHVHVMCAQDNLLGDLGPHSLLTKALAHLRRESVAAALAAVGLGFVDHGKVESDPEVFQTVWHPVAMAPVRFNLSEIVEDRIGYIESVEGALTLEGGGDAPLLEDHPIVVAPPDDPNLE